MASTVIVRHQCDRCQQLIEFDAAHEHAGVTILPEGWMVIAVAGQQRLLCGACQDGLRAFMAANEAAEQSR